MNTQNSRNYNIDFMRCVGFLCVILAHCRPPHILFQLRDFDVPLLIVTSAMTYESFASTKITSIKHFIVKRLSRLIIPCWFFLTLYFFIVSFLPPIQEIGNPFTLKQIIGSYSFYWGIGFVWILKVFAVMAILTPYLLQYRDKIKNIYIYFGSLLVVFFMSQLLIFYVHTVSENEDIIIFFDNVFLFIIPYAVVYCYGLKLSEIKITSILIFTALCLIIFVLTATHLFLLEKEIIPTNDYKYPPQLYYLAYAMIGTNVTYLMSKVIQLKGSLFLIMTWISKNSLWLYLWHILALTLLSYATAGNTTWWLWIFKFIGIILLSSIIILIQNKITSKVLSCTKGNFHHWVKIIFT